MVSPSGFPNTPGDNYYLDEGEMRKEGREPHPSRTVRDRISTFIP